MGDHDNPATCLSAFEHGSHVRDVVLHYFGCLRECERAKFFAPLPAYKKQRIREEEKRIRQQRALFEQDEETNLLVRKFKRSHNDFFKSRSEEMQKRIKDEEERLRNLPSILEVGTNDTPNSPESPNQQFSRQSTSSLDGGSNVTKPSKDNGFGFHAYAVFYRNSAPYDDSFCNDKFPNQRTPLKDLLYNKVKAVNPLMRDCEKDENEIRWFHFPGNNMEWVEEAIARHYNEDRPKYDGLFRRPENPSKSYLLLRPEFWRGQQHGGRHDAVHARHMRPRCDIISTDQDHLEDSPKNLVLFMPYLHWDTDRKRDKFEEIMRNITELHKKEEDEKAWKKSHPGVNSSVANGPQALPLAGEAQPTNGHSPETRPPKHRMISTATEAIHEELKHEVTEHPNTKFSKSGIIQKLLPGPVAPVQPLGKLLHRASLLFEAMDNYQEEQLLKECLHHDPPFHPRRTLDQSYYWTLKTTKKRDRDQVVYRSTAPKKQDRHSGNHPVKKEKSCKDCHDYARKIPRVIMVDQLWLWILEGNTIITSFPKRYGRNKPDPSAVHKSIRLRLKMARKNEIRSVYDLALVIIDQCSRVFFDRTKTADRQPQVIDMFANSIGDVTNRQTTLYEHFWSTTGEVSKVYKDKDRVDDAEDKAKALLDINPEGELLREVKDILDELHIMLNIKSKQQRVFKQFRKHVTSILAPGLALSKEIGTAKQKKITGDGGSEDEDNENNEKRKTRSEAEAKANAERDTKWTLEYALDLSAGLDDRIADLNSLKESAEHTEKALDGLLTLKQQQAGVVQARKAVEQTEETLRQGRSIMLFTVITIIFLPLSFGTSIFGMNTKEFNGGNWDFRTEMVYTFPISIAIIFVSFLLAFSTFTRAGLSFIFDLAWWNFITSTRIYTLWMEFKFDSADLNKRRLKTIRLWKESARDERLKRREEKATKKVADAAAAMASGAEGDRGVNGGAGGIGMRRRGDNAV